MLKRLDYNIQELKRHISNPIDENHLRTFIHFSYDLDKQRNNSLPEQLPKLWDQIKSFGEYSTLKE
jgi:hypothetical protein